MEFDDFVRCDLNSALTGALRTAADEDDVHVERLLAGARRTGTRYRRRRRVVIASCGAALTMALAAAGFVMVRPPAAGPSVAGSFGPSMASPTPSATKTPHLPEATAARSEVGSSPLLIHLSMAKPPDPASTIQWVSGDGQETLRIDGKTSFQVQASRRTADLDPLRGTRSDVTVNGRPGVIALETLGGRPSATVRWQPVAGLWAQVSAGLDRATALAVAADVRFDRVYRCAVPFRLTTFPAGTQVTTCNITFLGTTVQAMATVRIGTWYVTVGAQPGTVNDSNETLSGKPAHVKEHAGDGGARIMEIRVDAGGQIGDFTAEGPYDAAVVRSLAAGYVPTGGDTPEDWPTTPLG